MGPRRKARARLDIVTARLVEKVKRCQGLYWAQQQGEAWDAQAVG